MRLADGKSGYEGPLELKEFMRRERVELSLTAKTPRERLVNDVCRTARELVEVRETVEEVQLQTSDSAFDARKCEASSSSSSALGPDPVKEEEERLPEAALREKRLPVLEVAELMQLRKLELEISRVQDCRVTKEEVHCISRPEKATPEQTNDPPVCVRKENGTERSDKKLTL